MPIRSVLSLALGQWSGAVRVSFGEQIEAITRIVAPSGDVATRVRDAHEVLRRIVFLDRDVLP